MRALSGADILAVWEAGSRQHPIDRALTVLAVALGEAPDRLASLSVGARDALLLAVRESTFGSELAGYVDCDGCGQPLEFSLPVANIRVSAPPGADVGPHELLTEGITLRFRLPDSRDLGALIECTDPDQARQTLVARCVLEVAQAGEVGWANRLSSAAVAHLAARMAELDPQADVLLGVQCPGCGRAGSVALDIATFFWSELVVQAKRLLREVHALARAYAWPESHILAMSAVRRRCYLDMVVGA